MSFMAVLIKIKFRVTSKTVAPILTWLFTTADVTGSN